MSYRGMGRGDGFLGGVFKFGKSVLKGFELGGPIGAIAGARAGLPAKHHTAPIGSSTAGTIHHTHSAAIDTFLRRGGRFSAAGRAKLTKQHAEALAAGVHPAIATHLGGGRRRMNWANPRALGRAERRISSALHHFTKFFRWAHPGKSAGHAVPKFRRKRRK